MNSTPLRRCLLLASAAAVILAICVAISLQRSENTATWRAEAQRAAEALSSIEAIRARTSEAERNRFGYGITRDKTLLAQSRALLEEAVEERDRLSPRLTATAAQRQRLELLSGLLRDAQDLRLPGEALPPAPRVAPAKGHAAAPSEPSPILTLPKVRELGDLTRAVLRDLNQGEIDERDRALSKARWSDRSTDWILLGGVLAALFLGFIAFTDLRNLTLHFQRESATREAALQDAQTMLQGVDDGLVLLDPATGAVTAANDRFVAASGYPRGQLLDGSIRPFLPADPDAPSGNVLRLLSRAAREGAASSVVRLHPRSGGDRLVRAVFRRVTLAEGVRIEVVLSDVEELEKARSRAEAERDYLRHFLEPAASAAFLLDPERGTVLDATPEAAAYFATDLETLRAGRFLPFTPGEEGCTPEAWRSQWEKALTQGPQRFEWVSPDAKGRKIAFAVSLRPLDVRGQGRMLAVLTDVGAERRLRSEARDLRAKWEASQQNEMALRQDVFNRGERESKMKEELAHLHDERNRARAAQERLARPLVAFPGVVFALDGEGVYRLLEGRDLLKLGLSPGEINGKKASETPRGPLRSAELLQKVLAGESFSSVEEINGLYWDLQVTALQDGAGKWDGCVAALQDVSSRETERLAIRNRLNSIVALLESTPEAFLISDRDGLITFACGAGFHELGMTPWEAQGKTMAEVLPGEGTWDQSRRDAQETGAAWFSRETPQESFKGLLARVQPQGNDAPQWGCLLRPMGPPKPADPPAPPPPPPPDPWEGIALQAPVALVVLGADGTVRRLNPAASRLFGGRDGSALGAPWTALAPESARSEWEAALGRWRAVPTDILTLPFADGSVPGALEASAAPVSQDEGTDWVVALRPAPPPPEPDTRALESLRRLEHNQQEVLSAAIPSVSRLLADVADIRRNTVGLREKAGWAINPDGLRHLQLLEEAALDAAKRLEGWFDYQVSMSRPLRYDVVDLSTAARETAEARKADLERLGLSLIIQDLPMIEADPDLIHLLFRKIFDFVLAQDIPGHPPQVLVQAMAVQAPGKGSSPGWCQLSLEFDGPVRTEEALEQLFKAERDEDGLPGSGLGLLTVRRLAERHGGAVSAQPRAEGGIRLVVILPLLEPKA